jgi:hypothetical protein
LLGARPWGNSPFRHLDARAAAEFYRIREFLLRIRNPTNAQNFSVSGVDIEIISGDGFLRRI